MRDFPKAYRGSLEDLATGVIIYRVNGKKKRWSIGCMAWETEKHLKKHLGLWIPNAEFISGRIVPDKRKVEK